MVTRIQPTQLKNQLNLHRKKSNNWSIVSFIPNRSEITTWMDAQNPKQRFQDKNIFFVLNFKLQIIRLAQGHWSCMPIHWNSCFRSYAYEKNIFGCSFYQTVFVLSICWQKSTGLGPNCYLIAEDKSQVYIFFLT